MLILRSIVVYGATAGTFLWLAHRCVGRIGLKTALVLACAPLLFTGKAVMTGAVYGGIDILYDAMPFGAHRERLQVPPSRSPSLGDVVYQHIPWRAAMRRAVEDGRLPLWNPSVLGGEPLLAVQQAGILQPGSWIGLLLPPPQSWTFDMSLRLLIALLCAFLFMKDLGVGDVPALLGAAGWAFSDFFLFFSAFRLRRPWHRFPSPFLAHAGSFESRGGAVF